MDEYVSRKSSSFLQSKTNIKIYRMVGIESAKVLRCTNRDFISNITLRVSLVESSVLLDLIFEVEAYQHDSDTAVA